MQPVEVRVPRFRLERHLLEENKKRKIVKHRDCDGEENYFGHHLAIAVVSTNPNQLLCGDATFVKILH